MAVTQYNVPRGLTRKKDVTKAVSGAVASGLIQLTVDWSQSPSKREVLAAIETLEEYIVRDTFPPV